MTMTSTAIFKSSARLRISSQTVRQEYRCLSRPYATELPRPPPPTHEPTIETFASTAKPGAYYTRPPRQDLPPAKKKWPLILAFASAGVTGWGVFLLFATNQEKLSSSVVRQIMRTVRENPELRELLGDTIRPEPAWYLNGMPRINGKISTLQGNIDLSFRLKGHKGAGTLYFTSIRKAKGEPFIILRFKVIGDNGMVIHLPAA